MQRLVFRSFLAAASALFLLQTAACDKGGEKKADDKKVEAKVVEPAEPAEPAGTTSTTGGEPAGTTSTTGGETGGETGGGETGGGETGGGETGGGEKVEPEKTPTKVEPKGGDKTEPVAAKIDAKPLFESKCKSCHGSDGKGDTTIGKKVSIPSLAGTKISKAEAVKTITDGVADTKMKGYKDKLSKDEIDALAGYVKKL